MKHPGIMVLVHNEFLILTCVCHVFDTVPGSIDFQACLFVMVSPDEYNVTETISSLQFGSNARQVQLGEAKKNVRKGGPPRSM